jgi:lipoyl(octanoyl) transferase
MSWTYSSKLQLDLIKSNKPIPYDFAINFMDKKVEDISMGSNPAIWFLQHPNLYTYGSSANENDIIDLKKIPMYQSGRGGKITYHGPGQSICYIFLPLKRVYREPDIRRYINDLQATVIKTMLYFGLKCYEKDGMIGVWCNDITLNKPLKIAAIGVRVKKWITMHGIAININPDLKYFSRIIPCGIQDYGVTSCASQGLDLTIEEFNTVFYKKFLNTMNCSKGNEYEI